jgi:hypothetical protein
VHTSSRRRRVLSAFSSLTLLLGLLLLADIARAEPEVSAEVALGVMGFGEGPSPLEVGLNLDIGGALVLAEYLVTRATLGIAPVADRHSFDLLLRARVEQAVRIKLDWFVPMVGLGGSVLGRSPAAHGLLGLGFEVASGWLFGVDLRTGVLWDRDAARRGGTRFGEGQLRLSCAL